MKFKVAVVQAKIDISSLEKSLKKVEHYLKKTSGKADLIVFPEYLISWNFVDKDNRIRGKFQELSKKYKIEMVTGSMISYYKGKIYNTIYYIDSQGKIKGTYRKINLWHPERPHLAFGNEICVFNSKFGKIGLAICWDLAFPEIYRAMVRKGAEIVVCPAFWSNQDASLTGLKHNKNAERIFIDSCCLARAYENEIIHIFCNGAGTSKEGRKKWDLSGHSQITAPFKGIIGKLDHNKEGMLIREIDTSILRDAEKAYKIRADLKNRVI